MQTALNVVLACVAIVLCAVCACLRVRDAEHQVRAEQGHRTQLQRVRKGYVWSNAVQQQDAGGPTNVWDDSDPDAPER